MSGTAKRFRTALRLTCDASGGVDSRNVLEALLAEVNDTSARDFILAQPPRPELEHGFEERLLQLGFEHVFCRTQAEAVEILFEFESQSPPPLHYLSRQVRRVASELRPTQTCGTILSTRRGNRVVVKFKFEPRRTGLEQFTRYWERQASPEHGMSFS
jgi:hypothetical protein